MTAPRVILVVRLSAMGDLVMASGFASTLKSVYPQARIVWLVQDSFADVPALQDSIDEVVVWHRRDWQALWRAGKFYELWRTIAQFRAELRALRADWAIDLQGLLKSGLMAFWSGASRRVSLGGREGSRWLSTEVFDRNDDRPEERADMGAEYRALAEVLVGVPYDAATPFLNVQASEVQGARDWLNKALPSPQAQGPLIAMVPFTTRPQKHWPERSWQMVIDMLTTQSGFTLLILGGVADRQAAERILQGRADVIDAVGKRSIRESFALLSIADVVVGVDTGMVHAAQAFRRPTVVIFGSTIPYRKPLHPDVSILWSARSCSPCGRNPTCGGRIDCMSDWSPRQVADQVLRAAGEYR